MPRAVASSALVRAMISAFFSEKEAPIPSGIGKMLRIPWITSHMISGGIRCFVSPPVAEFPAAVARRCRRRRSGCPPEASAPGSNRNFRIGPVGSVELAKKLSMPIWLTCAIFSCRLISRIKRPQFFGRHADFPPIGCLCVRCPPILRVGTIGRSCFTLYFPAAFILRSLQAKTSPLSRFQEKQGYFFTVSGVP